MSRPPVANPSVDGLVLGCRGLFRFDALVFVYDVPRPPVANPSVDGLVLGSRGLFGLDILVFVYHVPRPPVVNPSVDGQVLGRRGFFRLDILVFVYGVSLTRGMSAVSRHAFPSRQSVLASYVVMVACDVYVLSLIHI